MALNLAPLSPDVENGQIPEPVKISAANFEDAGFIEELHTLEAQALIGLGYQQAYRARGPIGIEDSLDPVVQEAGVDGAPLRRHALSLSAFAGLAGSLARLFGGSLFVRHLPRGLGFGLLGD